MMTDSPLISIIIPVHDAESFLDECLRSVISQTYSNLEIITVDDDSTDKSKKIIEKYQNQDARIKYFYVNKHNAAQTRRNGATHALAKLICFVDADDILHGKYVEVLHHTMQETGAKITAGKIAGIVESSDIKGISEGTGKVHIEDDLLAYFGNNYHSIENNRHIAQSINAKLFTKDLFDNIDYSVLKTSVLEDNYIIAQLLQKVTPQKIALVDTTIYYYRQNQNSTMGSVLNHMIQYGDKEITYPQLFEKTMKYINTLYHKSQNVEFYTNKIEAEEYYNLARVVVDRNMSIDDAEIRMKEMKTRINDMEKHIDDLETRQVVLNQEIEDIVNSKSYRVGRVVTYPIRKFKEGQSERR